jgi:dolichol-phosphate mannosyltransferase
LVSVVVPIYNEAPTLGTLVHEISATLGEVAYEIILLDDGSSDASWSTIVALAEEFAAVRGIRLRRNFGKATALAVGFEAARGREIITLDADLQDDPAEIPRFRALLAEGYGVVSGWKKTRHDPLSKRLPSAFFNFITRATSGVKLHDFNCGFKAYTAEAAKSVRLYGELHRYIPVLAAAEGFRVGELVVNHRPRTSGNSKYGWKRFIRGALDLLTTVVLTRYLRRPAHFFGGLGLVFGAIGIGVLLWLTIGWFFGNRGIGQRPLFFFGILSTLLSAQMLSIGLIAELILFRTERRSQEAFIAEALEVNHGPRKRAAKQP